MLPVKLKQIELIADFPVLLRAQPLFFQPVIEVSFFAYIFCSHIFDSSHSVFIYLGTKIFDGLLGTGGAIAQFIEHCFDHPVV